MPNISISDLTDLTARALKRAGASKSTAFATARALVAADTEGLSGHGVSRTALYAQHLREGRVDGKAKAAIVKRKGATCLVDARGGLAYAAAAIAVTQAIERARRYGVSFCGVTNSHHFGAAGYHLAPIAEAGLIGLAFTNSPAAINAWGGKSAFYGTNPIAAVFPRLGEPPIVIDLSLTEVVRGKIMLYAKEGKPIPVGWALDRDGQPTTSAQAALTGSLSAIGGMKGTMLAMMVEVLCCAVTGAAFSFENDSYFEPGGKPRIGHALLAIDPDALAGGEAYLERVEILVSRMLEQDGVRLPGSRRHTSSSNARASGIQVPDGLHAELTTLAGGKKRART
ncbi:MAG TPA: Ldh family oxidoreductase [Burkholderiales bacterium]|nr:Ldh family oxidoreductase [Burkholderiales bacterium]